MGKRIVYTNTGEGVKGKKTRNDVGGKSVSVEMLYNKFSVLRLLLILLTFLSGVESFFFVFSLWCKNAKSLRTRRPLLTTFFSDLESFWVVKTRDLVVGGMMREYILYTLFTY